MTLLATIFVPLFFFIPYLPVTLDASKGFFICIGATLSVLFWLIACLGEGKFTIPKDRLILFAALIPLVFLISSFFSSSLYISFFGSGFEAGTFGSMLVLFIIFLLSSIYFQTEKRLWYFFAFLFIGAVIVAIFEFINIFIGFGRFPYFFQGISSGNVFGSWNNFALFWGLIILLSAFTIEFLKTKGILLALQYFLLVVGVLFLIIINLPLAWLLVGLFSVIIFVYNISIQHAGVKVVQGNTDGKKKFPFTALAIAFICLIFLFGNNYIGGFVSKYIGVSNVDVRPSFTATSQIALGALKHNPLFGTGPNTFVIDWAMWQPKGIAQTIYWNTDFTSGFSSLYTFALTTGLLGLISFLAFFVVFLIRGAQSLRVALKDTLSNYFIFATLITSVYLWITVIVYNTNIVMLMLAFASSGMLIGILVYKRVIGAKNSSFLNDPRSSFFSILGLVALIILSIFVVYVYAEKFASIIYFSKGLNNSNAATMESLSASEKMIGKAIALDDNDIYHRALSQVYVNEIGIIINDKTISQDNLRSNLQRLVNLAQGEAGLAVSRNPKQYANYINLGNVYSAFVPLSIANSYDSAVQAYNRASELAPNNPLVLLSRAQLEYANKNNDQAKSFIKQALDIKYNYIDAIFFLAQIETSEGNIADAIKQAEYASVLAPNDETVFFRLGMLRYNNGDYAGAISAFEQAVMLNTNYLDARYFLAQSYQKNGRIADALTQFKILSSVLPNNQDIKNAINSLSQSTQGTSANLSSPIKPQIKAKSVVPSPKSKK